MANDGRVSGSQQHVEYEAAQVGVASGVQQHVEYEAAALAALSGAQQHIEYEPVQVGILSGMLLMVEYSDVALDTQPTLVQGDFLFRRPGLQGYALRRGPWQIT